MKTFNKIFFRGLVAVLPLAVTIYIVYSAMIILENLLGVFIRRLLPEAAYIPGLGLLLILILIFVVGLALNSYVMGRMIKEIEKKLITVPFFKAIYSPLRDLMNLFSKTEQKNLKSVVLVRMGESQAQALGVVTRDNFSDLTFKSQAQGKVAVYFPLSYGLGGFTFLVPREQITEIDMPIEKAMSLAITGWVKVNSGEEK